jgi:hypothetical protein
METLENKVIVYDDSCPMCDAYTAGFVKIGWLKKRTGFANTSPEVLAKLDLNRARHEIPLYDTATGEVRYGLDALFLIIGARMPLFKPLFRSAIFRAPLYQLYQIITYNRRIIAASVSPKTGFDCAPDLNVFYRWVYIALAVTPACFLLIPGALANGWSSIGLLSLHGIALASGFFAGKRLDFAGHWATVFLVSALLFWVLPYSWITNLLLMALMAWMWRRRWPQVA